MSAFLDDRNRAVRGALPFSKMPSVLSRRRLFVKRKGSDVESSDSATNVDGIAELKGGSDLAYEFAHNGKKYAIHPTMASTDAKSGAVTRKGSNCGSTDTENTENVTVEDEEAPFDIAVVQQDGLDRIGYCKNGRSTPDFPGVEEGGGGTRTRLFNRVFACGVLHRKCVADCRAEPMPGDDDGSTPVCECKANELLDVEVLGHGDNDVTILHSQGATTVAAINTRSPFVRNASSDASGAMLVDDNYGHGAKSAPSPSRWREEEEGEGAPELHAGFHRTLSPVLSYPSDEEDYTPPSPDPNKTPVSPTTTPQCDASIAKATPSYESEVSIFVADESDEVSELSSQSSASAVPFARSVGRSQSRSSGDGTLHHNYDAKGRCVHHSHIRLRKKRFLGKGWKILMSACPDCCVEELRRIQWDEGQSGRYHSN